MNKTERIYRFHTLIKNLSYPSLKRIMEELECSESTVNRLKQNLTDYYGAPLKYDPEKNGYYYDESGKKFDLPGVVFKKYLISLLTKNKIILMTNFIK